MGNLHAHPKGYRAGTRDLFTKKFRTKGHNPMLSTYLRRYKVGETVDVIANPAQQKGMPHKFYQGRTGRIWNVNKRAIGVEINKVHRQRQIVKRIHVRVEHVRPSKCNSGHIARVAKNEAIKAAAKKSGKPADAALLKRAPAGCREGFTLDVNKTFENKIHLLTPLPYVFKPMELGRSVFLN